MYISIKATHGDLQKYINWSKEIKRSQARIKQRMCEFGSSPKEIEILQ